MAIGKLDLAFQTSEGTLSFTQPLLIYLGNGDGTYQNPTPYKWGYVPSWGDGHVDLAAMDAGVNVIYLLPGNGDGTFGPVEAMDGASTLLWLGIYPSQAAGYADLVTFNGALHTFVAPSGPAGVSISLLRNTGARQ